MTERIELATQTLVQERLGHQQMILETLKGEVNRTISRSLKLHLGQHFGPPKADQMQVNTGDDTVRSSKHPKDTGTVSESRRYCPGNEDTIRSTIGLENPTDKWVKKSLIGSKRDLIRNTTFGTVHSNHNCLVYSGIGQRLFRNKATFYHHPNLFACPMANVPGCGSQTSEIGILK
jgi:hypothetical protein